MIQFICMIIFNFNKVMTSKTLSTSSLPVLTAIYFCFARQSSFIVDWILFFLILDRFNSGPDGIRRSEILILGITILVNG